MSGPPRLLSRVLPPILLQTAMALAGIVLVLAINGDQNGALVDVAGYHEYASQVLEGNVPYRDFRIEYPPLVVPWLLLPAIFVRGRLPYAIAFAVSMLILNALLVILIARRVEATQGKAAVARRLWWYTLCFSVLCPLAVARYDLLPALLATAAAVMWFTGRRTLGGFLAGIGALVKVFPAVIAAFGLLWEARARRPGALRGSTAFLATLGAGVLLWFAVGGVEGVSRSIGFQSQRGLEVESLYSGLLLAASKIGATTAVLTYDETSWHVAAPGSGAIARASVILQLISLLAVAWLYLRRRAGDALRYAAAALVALIVTSKVLSPQFLLWVLPLLALVEGRAGFRARWVFLICCLATSVIFPWYFQGLLRQDVLAVVVLNLRNLLLVVLLFLLLYRKSEEGLPCE